MASEAQHTDGTENEDQRRRRLRMRAWRRGTREMDLLLGGYVDARGAALAGEELAALEAFAEIDDRTLYAWISGAEPAPEPHADLVARIAATSAAKP